MISSSRRSRRLERNQAKHKATTLSLVSLMDIFTILVFFLLVNSTDVEELPTASNINLPESIEEARSKSSPVLMLSTDSILIDGKAEIPLAAFTDGTYTGKTRLLAALQDITRTQNPAATDESNTTDSGPQLTIMGDRSIPYEILKTILATCGEAGFSDLALAVVQQPAVLPEGTTP